MKSTARTCLVMAFVAACCTSTARADSGSMAVTAVVLSKSSCRITGATTLNLAFGNINPGSPADATASASTTIRCDGSAKLATFSFTADGGQNASGPGSRRMKHLLDATQFLPYSIEITPSAATIPRSTEQLITINGTITPAQFRNAVMGDYSDTVAITVSP
jgi:spore coat protein U-like protein